MGSYTSVLRRRFGYVLVIAVALTPLLYLLLTPPERYVSTAAVQTGNTLAAGVIGVTIPYEDPENRLATEVELFSSTPVAERAATTLRAQGWSEDAADLADMVTMTQRGLSALLDIQGTADTPERARALTAAFLDAYLAERRAVQRSDLEDVVAGLEAQRAEAEASLAALGDVSLAPPEVQRQAATLQSWADVLENRIQQARLRMTVDASGVNPVASASAAEPVEGLATPLRIAVALAAALLVAVGVALLLDAWGNPVRTRREAAELLGLPIVGELPRVGTSGYRPDRALADPRHPVAAAARGLRLRIGGLRDRRPATVLVTAPPATADDGVHAATALAAAYGRGGQQVALVLDPSHHGQTWARTLRAEGRPVPVGTLGLDATPTAHTGVWLVPAAGHGGVPGLLDLPSPQVALDELHEVFDVVVLVDVAPGVPDAVAVGDLADVTLVVVALERIPAARVEDLRRTLEDFGVGVHGVVLARAWQRRALSARRRQAGTGERAPDPARRPEPLPAAVADDPAVLP